MTTSTLPFLVSAPGKIILFGEHSVVYEKPAIAASTASLRTYLLVSEANEQDSVELDFPDIKFNQKWSVSKLKQNYESFKDELLQNTLAKPSSLSYAPSQDSHLSPILTEKLIPPLLSNLQPNSIHYNAALCFLYLYFSINPPSQSTIPNLKFTIKSTLPIGAGLGSSASISVTLSAALLHLQDPTNHLMKMKDIINKWSYIGEKCIHGDPSGIDNLISTYGKAIYFQRNHPENQKILTTFPLLPMILTYTGIPRSTKTLVSGVRSLYRGKNTLCQTLLDAMGIVSEDALELFDHFQYTQSEFEELFQLVRINHGLLVSLGVSHPGLERIRCVSDELGIGETKLTGAGGGGCAFTILQKNLEREQVVEFKDKLENGLGYKTFETGLGGAGCCYLPRMAMTNDDLVNVLKVFSNSVSKTQLDSTLLPEKSNLSWII
ncbi:mevalonate kinase NDAI_0K01160 [Naumovozyma dairenensis CBS 421]|uniref:Mevalonate kinase n=1 Tax=Naumovozyma dairenensis (strain ATCC 10597 / BCRC 20456 / CBS 421 / NBRC 0211 / NRRL Y-12639) TaxID=1071378 RepID=G0WHP6_NAUDC|nr:hypothetical protein NDAI_0K01160 [Naumovozyma dairenensis CBS 421]CCD27307.1 hypothetical protein NDAI_0K01160 [Naumovozyma dairenensis CBS 421]